MVITSVPYSLYCKFSSTVSISICEHLDRSIAREQIEENRHNPEVIQELQDWLLGFIVYSLGILVHWVHCGSCLLSNLAEGR